MKTDKKKIQIPDSVKPLHLSILPILILCYHEVWLQMLMYILTGQLEDAFTQIRVHFLRPKTDSGRATSFKPLP